MCSQISRAFQVGKPHTSYRKWGPHLFKKSGNLLHEWGLYITRACRGAELGSLNKSEFQAYLSHEYSSLSAKVILNTDKSLRQCVAELASPKPHPSKTLAVKPPPPKSGQLCYTLRTMGRGRNYKTMWLGAFLFSGTILSRPRHRWLISDCSSTWILTCFCWTPLLWILWGAEVDV